MPEVETSTPAKTPEPIGPYSHIAKVGSLITIGGTAGVNPVTGQLAGKEIGSQTRQILDSFDSIGVIRNGLLTHYWQAWTRLFVPGGSTADMWSPGTLTASTSRPAARAISAVFLLLDANRISALP